MALQLRRLRMPLLPAVLCFALLRVPVKDMM
jgi:hypothetical protein